MTLNQYQLEATRTAQPPYHLAHLCLGLAGEAGEVADIVKKHVAHGHPLDREHLREELGDVLWYVAVLARALGSDLSEIAAINTAKLEKRYPAGFSTERSINR